MADGLTARVLDSSRAAPRPRPVVLSGVEPTDERATTRPALSAAVALAVVAAVIGRRRAGQSAPSTARAVRKQGKVMAVFLAAGVVIVAVWRPALSAYRDHRYSSRWSRQPLGW
jgi:lysylphosphatidylglycerol synthetase-like protein (DUF2156 family)